MDNRRVHVVTLRLVCFYCGEECVPVPKRSFFRTYNIWQHAVSGWIICPPHREVLSQMAIENAAIHPSLDEMIFGRVYTEPWPEELTLVREKLHEDLPDWDDFPPTKRQDPDGI